MITDGVAVCRTTLPVIELSNRISGVVVATAKVFKLEMFDAFENVDTWDEELVGENKQTVHSVTMLEPRTESTIY